MSRISSQAHVDRVRTATNTNGFLRSGAKQAEDLIDYLAALIQSYQNCTRNEYSNYGFKPDFSEPLRRLASSLSVPEPKAVTHPYPSCVSQDQASLNSGMFNILEFANYLDQVVRIFAKINKTENIPTTLFRQSILDYIGHGNYAGVIHSNKEPLINTKPLLKEILEIEKLSDKLADPNYHHLCIFDVDGTLRESFHSADCNIDEGLRDRLLCLPRHSLARNEVDIAFITGRLAKEVKASNLPYQEFPTFCNFGNQRLNHDGHYYPPVCVVTENAHQSKVQQVRETIGNIQLKDDRIGAIGISLEPVPLRVSLDSLRARLAALADDDWIFRDRGDTLWLAHKDFKLDKSVALPEIFQGLKRRDKPLRVYCFGDELPDELLMRALDKQKEDYDISEVCHVAIGTKIQDTNVHHRLSSHTATEALIADLVELG